MEASVYLAGPIAGCDEGEAHGWRVGAVEYLREYGIVGVNPLRNEPPGPNGKYDLAADFMNKHPAAGKAISAKNLFDVRNCGMTLIYLPRAINERRPSYGTVLEMGWAFAYGKPVVLVSDDPAVMSHPCVDVCVGWKFDNLLAGLSLIVQIMNPYIGAYHKKGY